MPKGWAVTTLGSICTNINGLWKGKKEPFINVGVIRNANFTKQFNIDYSKVEFLDVELRAFEKRHLLDGDLIVEKSGGSDTNPVGRAILYQGKDKLFSFSNFTMILRLKNKEAILSKYLYYHLLIMYQKGITKSMQTQTTGLHNLILNKYLSMTLFLPPKQEQKRIIDKINGLFFILNTMEDYL